MPGYHFEDVSPVLVDSNRDVRSSIRAGLRHKDLGKVRATRVLPHLAARVAAAFPADKQTAAITRDIADSVARLAE